MVSLHEVRKGTWKGGGPAWQAHLQDQLGDNKPDGSASRSGKLPKHTKEYSNEGKEAREVRGDQ